MILSAERLLMSNVSIGYGASNIILSMTLHLEQGRITTVAGPNGAGKSTVMKALAGLLRPRQGRIMIGDRDITSHSPSERAQAGLAYVPQERNVFKALTIGDNFRISFEFIRPRASYREFIVARDGVLDLFPDLRRRLNDVAGTLSGGQRQMLAMACALISKPAVLLLDEPSAGLSPHHVTTILEALEAVNRAGATIVMVEQNLVEAMRISHHVVLLVAGRIQGVWNARSFLADPDVRSMFLGGMRSTVTAGCEGGCRDDASAA